MSKSARMSEFYKRIARMLPSSLAQDLYFASRTKRWPEKEAPQRFTDKIHAYKRCYPNVEAIRLVDKVEAKKIVGRIIGVDWIIPTLFVGDKLPEDLSFLPDGFAVKAAHGSGWNHFVKPGEAPDWARIAEKVKYWVSARREAYLGEKLYDSVPQRILIEPLLGNGRQLPEDYKIFVFDGRAEFIQVDTQREFDHHRNFYSTEWQPLPFAFKYPQSSNPVPRPHSLAEMLRAAEQIADPFRFARVDFYDVAGSPYFGEVTFFPEAGAGRFTPDRFDYEIGKLWKSIDSVYMARHPRKEPKAVTLEVSS